MNYIEIIGALIGLLYLWFEYRVSIWLWPVGVIMPAVYILVYYLIAGIYGWVMWRKGTGSRKECEIANTPLNEVLFLSLVFCVLFVFIGEILVRFTDSTVPWLDSFTTALSFIAMWMLTCKYLEQSLVWIVVDVFSCGLYLYKELYFTSILYGLYALIAIFGYIKWKQLMRSVKTNE